MKFAIGMGPKIFCPYRERRDCLHDSSPTAGGYVRMAGWGEDTTEIKTGTPVSLTLAEDGKVKRINLSGKKVDQTALPMQVPSLTLRINSLSQVWFGRGKNFLRRP